MLLQSGPVNLFPAIADPFVIALLVLPLSSIDEIA